MIFEVIARGRQRSSLCSSAPATVSLINAIKFRCSNKRKAKAKAKTKAKATTNHSSSNKKAMHEFAACNGRQAASKRIHTHTHVHAYKHIYRHATLLRRWWVTDSPLAGWSRDSRNSPRRCSMLKMLANWQMTASSKRKHENNKIVDSKWRAASNARSKQQQQLQQQHQTAVAHPPAHLHVCTYACISPAATGGNKRHVRWQRSTTMAQAIMVNKIKLCAWFTAFSLI